MERGRYNSAGAVTVYNGLVYFGSGYGGESAGT
jgi:hypothetical protein